jgi:hypothetical protein
MKFRTIFILFNVVIIVSFAFVFFLPFFLLGSSYSIAFWSDNWILALFFLVLVCALNIFFLANRKVFVLVEREDWGGLSAYLVDKIFAKGRYRPSHVRLLVNAYLLQSDVGGIERLEAELAAKKPAVLRNNAVLFGVARLLRNRPAEAENFLAHYLDAKDVEDREWLRFDYAFSLVLQRRVADALPILREGCSSHDAVLALLSAYLIGSLGEPTSIESEREELRRLAEDTRERLSGRFAGPRWAKEVEKAKNEVHIVILSKLIDDASRWLFAKAEEKGGQAATETGERREESATKESR